jgi:hypothetical protein
MNLDVHNVVETFDPHAGQRLIAEYLERRLYGVRMLIIKATDRVYARHLTMVAETVEWVSAGLTDGCQIDSQTN